MTTPITDTLRQALQQQPISIYQISQETGIDPSILSRFIAGKRSLRLDTADILAQYLNVTVVRSLDNTRSTRKYTQ